MSPALVVEAVMHLPVILTVMLTASLVGLMNMLMGNPLALPPPPTEL